MKNRLLPVYFFFLLLPSIAFSQTDTVTTVRTRDTTRKPATFTFGIDFYSNLHYYGRVDSLRSTAWVPNVFWQFGNGIFVNSSLIFINSSGQALKYTAATLGAGYKWGKPGRVKGWGGSFYAAKFFYSNKILIQSSQDGQIGATLNYTNKIANLNFGTSLVFGDQSDYFMNVGTDHLFRKIWDKGSYKNIFAFIPTLNVNAGTQRFNNSYYQQRLFPLTDTLIVESSKKFKILSVELNVPFVYIHNRLAFTLTPGVVFPTNVIKVAGRPDLSENAKTLGYVNFGVSYSFGRRKK